jgi:hypothetical protein
MHSPENWLIFILKTNEGVEGYWEVCEYVLFKTPMIRIKIMSLGTVLLCRRTNDVPEFVKDCRNNVAKKALHLGNPDDFALGMELGGILNSYQPAFKVPIMGISLQSKW